MKRIFPFLILLMFMSSGCKPTYPKTKVSDSIIKLCRDEYNTEVKLKTAGKTLGVYMPIDNLLDSSLQPSEESFEKLGNVLHVLSRVALSTNADLEFITLVASDSKISGFELVLTRYVKDIKRFMVGDISRGEYMKRMLFETKVDPLVLLSDLASKDKKERPESGEFSIEEVHLPDFLAKQISRRIEDKFKEDKHLKGNFKVVAVNGEFSLKVPNLERGILKFTLDIIKKREMNNTLPERIGPPPADAFSLVWRGVRNGLANLKKRRQKKFNKEDILPISLETVRKMLRRYNFKDFAEIEILDTNTGKSLVVNNKTIAW
ncbi:hypothetical protein ES706_04445 [subsurface metagenome]|nr:hypothetical protein [Bacillota bacterium]